MAAQAYKESAAQVALRLALYLLDVSQTLAQTRQSCSGQACASRSLPGQTGPCGWFDSGRKPSEPDWHPVDRPARAARHHEYKTSACRFRMCDHILDNVA